MNITLTWSRPVTRVNGNALPYTEIVDYRIEQTSTPGGATEAIINAPKGPEANPQETVSIDRPVGVYFFRVKTNTINPDGSPGSLSSVESNEIQVTLDPCTPATCGASPVTDLASA